MSKLQDLITEVELRYFWAHVYGLKDHPEIAEIFEKSLMTQEVVPISGIHLSEANSSLYGLPLHDSAGTESMIERLGKESTSPIRAIAFAALTREAALKLNALWSLTKDSDYPFNPVKMGIIVIGEDPQTKTKAALDVTVFQSLKRSRFFRNPYGLNAVRAYRDAEAPGAPFAVFEFLALQKGVDEAASGRIKTLLDIEAAINWTDTNIGNEDQELNKILEREFQ